MSLTDTRRWKPVCAPITNSPGMRSPEALRAVVAQFDVEVNPRYARTDSTTWCNIFAWDVTTALGCEIPHWDLDHENEYNVNATLKWLETEGYFSGWQEIDAKGALEQSTLGCPVVAVWKNPNPVKHGHIAVLLPPRDGEIRIAQAGAKNLFDVRLADGFGAVQPIRFFRHA
jgi:hypothetical protein